MTVFAIAKGSRAHLGEALGLRFPLVDQREHHRPHGILAIVLVVRPRFMLAVGDSPFVGEEPEKISGSLDRGIDLGMRYTASLAQDNRQVRDQTGCVDGSVGWNRTMQFAISVCRSNAVAKGAVETLAFGERDRVLANGGEDFFVPREQVVFA